MLEEEADEDEEDEHEEDDESLLEEGEEEDEEHDPSDAFNEYIEPEELQKLQDHVAQEEHVPEEH